MRVLLIYFFIFAFSWVCDAQNFTVLKRRNVFLSRKRRYLQWPKGSNFVINFTCSKPLLRPQPLTWNIVYEMDVPFAVPPDIDIFFKSNTKTKRDVLERKNFLEKMEDFLTIMGFNGPSCIKRLLCESDDFVKTGGKSLLRDLIGLLFRSFSDSTDFEEYENACFSDNFTSCPISLLDIFINSSYNGVEHSV